jgi:hypothetical protein
VLPRISNTILSCSKSPCQLPCHQPAAQPSVLQVLIIQGRSLQSFAIQCSFLHKEHFLYLFDHRHLLHFPSDNVVKVPAFGGSVWQSVLAISLKRGEIFRFGSTRYRPFECDFYRFLTKDDDNQISTFIGSCEMKSGISNIGRETPFCIS